MKLRSFLKIRKNRWSITDKMFFSLFMTGTVIEFSQVGAGFVDGLVVSRYMGSMEMAAQGIAHPIFSIMGIISGLIAIGMQVKCSQSIGRGNVKEYSEFVSASVIVGTVASLIISALVLIFAEPFAMLLGASGNAANLAELSAQYLTGIGIGVPPLILTAILAPALQLDSGSNTVRTGALIETASNVVMDIIAVRMGWGLLGIGLASAIASYANLLYQCSFFLRKERSLHLVIPKVPVKEFLHMLANGNEKAVKRLMNTIRPVILNMIIISYGGAVAMSSLSVRNNFSDFIEIFGAGIAAAVSLLVGVYYGEINEEGIEEVCSFGQKMILLFSGSICVLVFIFARPIGRLYVKEGGELLDMTVFAIRMLALQNPLQAVVASRIKYLQAIRRNRNMNMLIFAAQLVFVLLSAFVLGKLFGVYGILACYTVSDFLSIVAVYVFYAIKGRNQKVSKQDYLNLPEEFHLKPGDVISLDVRNGEDVSLSSEQIMMFCKGHNLTGKVPYYAALAFEELAANIIANGFPNNTSLDPMIDLRVVIADNDLVIRMRDNCPRFDVTAQIAEANAEGGDPVSNIGIRIVSKIASEITYLHTFDTNSLIMHFSAEKS